MSKRTCSKGCTYIRDAGECLRQQGHPGAGGSFGDWCECECHTVVPEPPKASDYGPLGVSLDNMTTEQVRYELYAAEQAIQTLERQRDEIMDCRFQEVIRAQACKVVLKGRT